MQISASYLTGLTNSLNEINLNQQSLTNELSSGVRVNSLSDDPSAAGENVSLSAQLAQDVNYQQASNSVTSLLQVKDSALGSVISQLTQAISVATQGVGGTENTGDTSTVVTRLSGIRDEVLSLANTTYQGNYLFSGSLGNTQPFLLDSSTNPATTSYAGDSIASTLGAPDGSSVQIGTPGNVIFSASGTNVLGTLNQLISDFTNGNTAGATAATDSLTGLVTYVAQQRSGVDNSISRIATEQGNLQSQSTQLTVQQTTLMQANTAQVATSLSASETQLSALEDAIAAIEKQGTLFNVIG
jgi:flagellar hook-associated protein 3 FlgL